MTSAPVNKRYLSAPVRQVGFPPAGVESSYRPDGSLVVRPLHPLGPYPDKLTERLDHWAAHTPDRVFLAERDRSQRMMEFLLPASKFSAASTRTKRV